MTAPGTIGAIDEVATQRILDASLLLCDAFERPVSDHNLAWTRELLTQLEACCEALWRATTDVILKRETPDEADGRVGP
jgi:hypothetical protein